MIKESILQEDMTILHVYVPNKRIEMHNAKKENCKEK